MKAIQYTGNTPAVEVFVGHDLMALQRIANNDCTVISLIIHVEQGKISVNMNDWIIEDDRRYYVVSSDAYCLIKRKDDKIELIKEMMKNSIPDNREEIIREVANYIAPYSKEAADLALEVISANVDKKIKFDEGKHYWKKRCLAAENMIHVMQSYLLVPKKNQAKAAAELKIAHEQWEKTI